MNPEVKEILTGVFVPAALVWGRSREAGILYYTSHEIVRIVKRAAARDPTLDEFVTDLDGFWEFVEEFSAPREELLNGKYGGHIEKKGFVNMLKPKEYPG